MSDAFQIVVQTAAAPVAKNGKPASAALSARSPGIVWADGTFADFVAAMNSAAFVRKWAVLNTAIDKQIIVTNTC